MEMKHTIKKHIGARPTPHPWAFTQTPTTSCYDLACQNWVISKSRLKCLTKSFLAACAAGSDSRQYNLAATSDACREELLRVPQAAALEPQAHLLGLLRHEVSMPTGACPSDNLFLELVDSAGDQASHHQLAVRLLTQHYFDDHGAPGSRRC